MTEPSRPEPTSVARTFRPRPIAVAALGFSVIGVLIGGLGAWIAPPIHVAVAITRAGERVHEYLGTDAVAERFHRLRAAGDANALAAAAERFLAECRAARDRLAGEGKW